MCVHENQASFRSNRGSIDKVSLSQTLEHRHIFCSPTISVFPDLKVAFDLVDHAILWQSLADECAREICSAYSLSVRLQPKLSSDTRIFHMCSPRRVVFVGVVSFYPFFFTLLMRWLRRQLHSDERIGALILTQTGTCLIQNMRTMSCC